MNATQSVTALTGALVHRTVTNSAVERSRHEAFIGQKLAASFATLAIAPFYLAFHGIPSPADCMLFSLGLLPMGAAMLVARTGRVVLGHAVVFASLTAVAGILFAARDAGAGAAIAWLIVAQVEGALAFDKRLMRGIVAIGALALCAIVVAAGHGFGATVAPFDGVIAGFALLYGLFGSRDVFASALRSQGPEDMRGDRWRAVAEALGDLVVGFDAAGSVDRVSAACETMLGLPRHELVGRGLFDRVHVADRPAFLKLIADAAHGDATMTGTVRMRAGGPLNEGAAPSAPRHVWVEMRAKSVAAEGRLVHAGADVVAILRDVTVARQHDLDLEQAHRASEQAIQAKDHFLANMSHELRTPLNAIIGFSEMLGSRTMRPIDPEKQREYATIIHGSGQHLLAVVNSILDMSKIQSGTFAILPEPFAVAPLIDQCCDMVRLEAQTGHVSLSRDVPTDLEELVGDRRACKQILLNLLSNAVKFTPEFGQVVVKVRPEGNTLVITVSDTGIGITATDLACLGDPFFQARSSLSRPYEGTGLGLSVVRGLLGLHGGTIAMESEIGKGTLVTVRLPLDCRVPRYPNATTSSARIETIPRRQTPDVFTRAPDIRMKQIA